MSQAPEQAPFTTEFVGSILYTDSREKGLSMLCHNSSVFYGYSGLLPQGNLTGWVRMNIVTKVLYEIVVNIPSHSGTCRY